MSSTEDVPITFTGRGISSTPQSTATVSPPEAGGDKSILMKVIDLMFSFLYSLVRMFSSISSTISNLSLIPSLFALIMLAILIYLGVLIYNAASPNFVKDDEDVVVE